MEEQVPEVVSVGHCKGLAVPFWVLGTGECCGSQKVRPHESHRMKERKTPEASVKSPDLESDCGWGS